MRGGECRSRPGHDVSGRSRFWEKCTVDTSTALSAYIHNLADRVEDAEWWPTAVIAALTAHLRGAIPSYVGLELTTIQLGQQVTLTVFEPGAQLDDIATSLELSLPNASGRQPVNTLSFYAAAPGAFVDLAADQGYAQRRRHPGAGGAPRAGLDATASTIRLDERLRPTTVLSGVVGADELATVNRAVGMLIDEGQDEPERELLRRAAGARLSTHEYATQLLLRGRRGTAEE
jgi:hypothetical protein